MESAAGVRSRLSAWPRLAGMVPEPVTLALLPLLIAVAMVWPALTGQGVFAPTDIVSTDPLVAMREPGTYAPQIVNPTMADVVDTFIPWKFLVRDELAAGRFPLWNPYNLVGTPLHANLQSQVFSPFNLLWLLLPPLWGLGAVAALKWALGGLGMALLLRRLGVGVPAAVFGSVAFQLSGQVVAWLQWPIADGLIWLPWTMWAALAWVETLRPAWLAALAAFVAAEWLAGHVETSFHCSAMLLVFCLAAWGTLTPSGKKLRGLVGLAGAAALGLALSAAQLVPFLDVLPASYQAWLRARSHTAGFALSPDAMLMWLTPNGFGWPDAYFGPRNWIEANSYVGAPTLLLAAMGAGLFVRRPRARITLAGLGRAISPRLPLFWAVLLAATFSMSYGIPPLSLLRELPGFNTSFNWRLISAAGFCAVVLAALAFERLVTLDIAAQKLARVWRAAPVVFGVLALGFASVGLQVFWISSKPPGPYDRAWQAWAAALFCACAALILARLLGWLDGRVCALLLIGLIVTDMVRAGWGFNPTLSESTFYPESKLLSFVAGRGPTERTAVIGPYAEANMLVPYRVPEYSLYDATIDNRYIEYTRLMSPETFRAAFRNQDDSLTVHLVLTRPYPAQLSALGIKWVIANLKDDPNLWQPVPATGPIYKRTLTKNGFTLWENLYARPFTYLAPRVHLITPQSGKDTQTLARERMQALSLPSLDVAQVEDPSGLIAPDLSVNNNKTPLASGESAQLVSYAPGEIKVTAKADIPRLLVVNEGWSLSWRAEIDGKPAPIYRNDYVLQSVVVPPGEHSVRFVYDPPAFRIGVGISLAAIVVWFGILLLPPILKRRKPRSLE